MSDGGVTPSHGLIRAAVTAANGLPVHVLLRPRIGDFVYSDAEFDLMCDDLQYAAGLGVAGFVTGILTAERTVDEQRMLHLVKLAGDKEVTFHRAFDHTPNLTEALEQIIGLGCQRLLTSGGKPTVPEGMHAIVKLVRQARSRIRIAAGGGVTPAVATELRRMANVDVHVSLRRNRRFDLRDPLWNNDDETTEISVDDVREMASVLGNTAEPSSSK